MTVNRIIEDKELGPLFVRVNARARRLTFRTKEDGIHVTVPPRTSLAEVENAIEQLRPRLRAARQKQVRKAERPSVLEKLQHFKSLIQAAVVDRTKRKELER